MLHLLLFKKISKKSQVNAMKRNVNLADEMLVNKIVSNFYLQDIKKNKKITDRISVSDFLFIPLIILN